MSSLLTSFIRHEAALRRLLSRYLSRPQDVEDILQETYLRAFAADAKERVRAPRAYLMRVAKHLALNELARKANTTVDYIEDSGGAPVLEDESLAPVDDQVAGREMLATVAEAIAAMPQQCRRVFVMRKIDGLSFKAIADRLSISVSTAEKHAATGLVRCVDHLRRRGYASDDIPGVQRRTRRRPDGRDNVTALPVRTRGV